MTCLASSRNTGSAVDDLTELFQQIDDLMSADTVGDLARYERTLTDGYAHALSLEAERLRLSKRMNELASSLTGGEQEAKTIELSAVAARLESSRTDLRKLRSALADLRDRADAVRAATA